MKENTPLHQIAAIFREAGKAHHLAFLAQDGHDPDWARWYADYLLTRLMDHLKPGVSSTELSELLTEMDEEHRRESPGEDWPDFYARRLIQSELSRSA